MRRTISFAALLTVGACCSLGVVGMRLAAFAAAGATPTIEESAAPPPTGAPVTEPSPPVTQPTPAAEVAQARETATAVAAGTAPAAPVAASATPAAAQGPATLAQDAPKAGALVDLMNGARLEEGLAILDPDPGLEAAAFARAEDLVRQGYFDHYGPEGESAFTELAARGIRYRLAGENLARNNFPEPRTVEAAYEALMASPGHRANILEPRFGSVGVAAVLTGKVWLYVIVFTN